MVSSANAGGLVIPVSYSTSLNPVPMVTSLSTTPLLSVGSGKKGNCYTNYIEGFDNILF